MAVLAPRGWERGSADASEPGAVGGVATRRGEGSCFTPWRFHTFTGLATSPSPAACPGPPSTGRAGRADALLQTPTPWLRAGALARPFSTAHQFHLEEGSGKGSSQTCPAGCSLSPRGSAPLPRSSALSSIVRSLEPSVLGDHGDCAFGELKGTIAAS
ncbi:hypothetical protein Y1Q_0022308 [Alligator mississippiensis]|uniref:Uncharacterized protein n=1 Tax=Alligator mississippiensis TaxID=8496 RepID=A0A151P0U7_ALLMI|nr:hypothetical protein Y1Q_0022308 [Alligator mississippiensis]